LKITGFQPPQPPAVPSRTSHSGQQLNPHIPWPAF